MPLRDRPRRARRVARARPSLDGFDLSALMRSAASWTLDECLANEDLRERGLAVVVFVRRAPDGQRAAAGFVVDLFCRGVCDVQVVGPCGLAAVHDLCEDLGIGEMRRIDPFLAAKVVRSGVAWARGLGLPAHRDYVWARAIFDRIDDRHCVEEVPCGRFGKPVVVAGPGADVRRVIDRLERRLGPDGYTLALPLGIPPEG